MSVVPPFKDPNELKRRKRERIIILITLIILVASTYLEAKIVNLGLKLPFSNSLLIFALININALLLILVVFLVVRNLVKLILDRRHKIIGARLRTKLVIAFVGLSLAPTVLLFIVSLRFVGASIEYWFNVKVEQSLENSIEVGKLFYKLSTQRSIQHGKYLSNRIIERKLLGERRKFLNPYIEIKRKEYGLGYIGVYDGNLKEIARSTSSEIHMSYFKRPSQSLLRKAVKKTTFDIQSSPAGDFVTCLVPITSKKKGFSGIVVLSFNIPVSIMKKMDTIAHGLEGYQQLALLKRPLKLSLLLTLSILTLLIIFAATGFGLYLAKEITVPIKQLAEGTQRIAKGDYNFQIDLESPDEIGVLVNSFNKMTRDLKQSKLELERTNAELRWRNLEIEERRRYMETVLSNIATGVFSLDKKGRISTINPSAEQMMGIEKDKVIGKLASEVFPLSLVEILEPYITDKNDYSMTVKEAQIKIPIGNREVSLFIKVSPIIDEYGEYTGIVVVLEDMTELEKIQRMSAWREVARRIAHEVKNPLTPIKLSAQRLQHRFGPQITEGKKIFEECTETIVQQVEELKNLVNEFSLFARMPTSNPVPNDLNRIVEETLILYREPQKGVSIKFKPYEKLPPLKLDVQQIKRVLINLIDNAIAAINGSGEVIIETDLNLEKRLAILKISDTGTGIPSDITPHLFEPYFSTKKSGTGLGLAIVKTIISDHQGYIHFKPNNPRGTIFVIELPIGEKA